MSDQSEDEGTTEVDDQPMGVPAEDDGKDAPAPGLPDKEPPNSG